MLNNSITMHLIHGMLIDKYPKSTDQISGGIWTVNETGLNWFFAVADVEGNGNFGVGR